jgi:putative modified peptide
MTKQISEGVSSALNAMQLAPAQGARELDIVLSRLTNDDDFRERLLCNPVATLASIGIAIDPALVPAERILPSKERIVTDQHAIAETLGSTKNMVIFLLSGNS